MKTNTEIKLFEDRQVRTTWNEEEEQWYFSIVDVVEVLTDSADPKQYIKKMKVREPELSSRWGTICTPTEMNAKDGKRYRTQAASIEGIFRIIQSIPSPKAEPFKLWMAQVASQRLDQLADPERSINQALKDYKRLGYSDNWINQRLKSIEIRKDLTDQWKHHNVQEGTQYATLTDIIYQTWAGRTAKQYKQLKGLKKENLRDNMTNEELVLNMLAELSTTSITKAKDPQTIEDNKQCAAEGGNVARVAREELESKTGKSVVSPLSAQRFFEGQKPKEIDDNEIKE
ncbi:MAG: Bro-N domain-containing protein [Prevotellaceae bacterium]|nr:Bro-N domain-containing protein [Candidatus Colivivens equi]